jgi:hypothetical protein
MNTSAPALPTYGQQWTSPSLTTTTSSVEGTCTCTGSAALSVEQGQTLKTQMTVTVNDAVTGLPTPVDITGHQFQFTAKPTYDTADDDPATVKVDWYETNTPTQGITYLQVAAAVTATMQAIAYPYQVRMVSPSGIVSPLTKGTLTVIQPLSARF